MGFTILSADPVDGDSELQKVGDTNENDLSAEDAVDEQWRCLELL